MAYHYFYTLYLWLVSLFFPWVSETDQVTLITLPPEILLEIMKHMDYRQLVSVRMTCKRLCTISQSRDLWLRMMARLIHASHVHPPEEEIDTYTNAELEKWVIQRSLVRDTISGAIRAKPCCHSVKMPIEYVLPLGMTSQILPGGRWLLLFAFVSCYAVDLDSHHRTPKLLFDPTEFDKEIIEQENNYPIHREYWIDYNKESLSFRVAIHYTDTIQLRPRVHIHEIKLVGHNQDATLVAKHITSFFHADKAVAFYFLNENYIIEVKIPDGSLRFRIFHYSPTIGSFSRTGMRTLEALQVTIEGDNLVRLPLVRYIYGNMVAVATQMDYIGIYKIMCDADANPITIQRLHTISFEPQAFRHISPFRILNGSCWLTRTWNKEWHRVEIPHDGTEPKIEFLGEVSSDASTAQPKKNGVVVDILSSMIFTDTDEVEIIDHLPGRSGGLHSRFIPFQLPVSLRLLRFVSYNEDTGRVIFYAPFREETIFVDLTSFTGV